jgi:hypothetical protein
MSGPDWDEYEAEQARASKKRAPKSSSMVKPETDDDGNEIVTLPAPSDPMAVARILISDYQAEGPAGPRSRRPPSAAGSTPSWSTSITWTLPARRARARGGSLTGTRSAT